MEGIHHHKGWAKRDSTLEAEQETLIFSFGPSIPPKHFVFKRMFPPLLYPPAHSWGQRRAGHNRPAKILDVIGALGNGKFNVAGGKLKAALAQLLVDAQFVHLIADTQLTWVPSGLRPTLGRRSMPTLVLAAFIMVSSDKLLADRSGWRRWRWPHNGPVSLLRALAKIAVQDTWAQRYQC